MCTTRAVYGWQNGAIPEFGISNDLVTHNALLFAQLKHDRTRYFSENVLSLSGSIKNRQTHLRINFHLTVSLKELKYYVSVFLKRYSSPKNVNTDEWQGKEFLVKAWEVNEWQTFPFNIMIVTIALYHVKQEDVTVFMRSASVCSYVKY